MRFARVRGFVQIHAGAEAEAGAAQNQHALRFIRRRGLDGLHEFAHQLDRERVAALGPVQGQGGLRGLFLDQEDGHAY